MKIIYYVLTFAVGFFLFLCLLDKIRNAMTHKPDMEFFNEVRYYRVPKWRLSRWARAQCRRYKYVNGRLRRGNKFFSGRYYKYAVSYAGDGRYMVFRRKRF